MQSNRTAWRGALLLAGLVSTGDLPFAAADEPVARHGEIEGQLYPDVVVSDFTGFAHFGYVETEAGFVSALAVGPVACNIGPDPLRFESLPSVYHPLFRHSMYRLANNRLEQIGVSWVFHGFYATNAPICSQACERPAGAGGSVLYPGCATLDSASIIGVRSSLSSASQVNAFTGLVSPPLIQPAASDTINGRLQVHNVDLDPALNPEALYFIEGHVLAADDAAAGNGNNNASHRRVTIVNAATFPHDSCSGTDPQKFCVSPAVFIYESQPAIRAWKNADSAVVETDVQIAGEGLFILAALVTDLGTGLWRYEYALQNVNSDRSGRSFSLPLPFGAVVSNVGFHDVNYHSGDPYSNTDWDSTLVDHAITWSTEEYTANPSANALRWGTLYNFRFDSNAPPASTIATIELFKPGTPAETAAKTIGPIVDHDGDGDFDLADFSGLLQCFSGATPSPADPASSACRMAFDHDENKTIDLADFEYFRNALTGPAGFGP